MKTLPLISLSLIALACGGEDAAPSAAQGTATATKTEIAASTDDANPDANEPEEKEDEVVEEASEFKALADLPDDFMVHESLTVLSSQAGAVEGTHVVVGQFAKGQPTLEKDIGGTMMESQASWFDLLRHYTKDAGWTDPSH